MKDFLKWLGVNEKVAKIVVWIFIAIIMLILTNTLLESVGLPYYKITVDNLNKIASSPKIISYILSGIVNILNFYSIVLIVFRVKNIKKMIIPAILCPILTGIVNILTIGFCYFFSGKQWKYLLYGILSMGINAMIQYICYLYKARFIDFSHINSTTRIILGLDFLIVMAIVILVKEIYLRKRGENNGRNTKLVLVGNIREGKQTSKKNSKKINKK